MSCFQARYYQEKLGLNPNDPAAIRGAVGAYIAGLHWVVEYYYRGVASWAWYYPFHYAPIVSDMTDLHDFQPAFERGEPFTPYQQLLAVMPAASHQLLPRPYQVQASTARLLLIAMRCRNLSHGIGSSVITSHGARTLQLFSKLIKASQICHEYSK